MSDIVNDPNIAETSDQTLVDTTKEYWQDGTNEEVETQPVQEPVQEANAQTPENTGQTEEQRYQYWQSRYDQKASEFDNISKKLAEYEKIAPIAEYIQENPDALKGVARSLSGDNPGVPSQEKSQTLPQKPERPTKPMNYDATESVMDAESDSFKYRQAMDDYRDNMIDFHDQMEVHRLNQLKVQEEKIAQQRQAYEAQKAQEGMKQQLMNQYGYAPEKADEFIKYYSSPESISLDNLVSLDKLRSAPSQQEVATQQKVQALQNQQERLAVPTPTAIQSGETKPNFSEEDLFNLGLMANKR